MVIGNHGLAVLDADCDGKRRLIAKGTESLVNRWYLFVIFPSGFFQLSFDLPCPEGKDRTFADHEPFNGLVARGGGGRADELGDADARRV